MKKNRKNNIVNSFRHRLFTKLPWEFCLALVVNILIIALFFLLKQPPPKQTNGIVEISVDISDFTPSKPKEMILNADSNLAANAARTTIETLSEIRDVTDLATDAMRDFIPQTNSTTSLAVKTAFEQRQELERIEQGIRTFDGISQVQTGLPEGVLPAGHQTGASFSSRISSDGRARLLRRHGGDEKTESAVEKALVYLGSVQNSNGSWGSADSFQTGDTAALSSLALLAFFSHGETFLSKRHGETIRRGCDFLIELSNTPNIEYAGRGFGHAILTYALAEGFAVTGSMSLQHALENRVKYIIANQNKFGSFAMNYDNSPQAPPTVEQLENPLYREIIVGEPACDLSLLGWHIQALTAARNAGIQLEGLDSTLELATESLVKIHQAKKGGFSQGINMKRFDDNENMTPVGLLGLHFLNAGKSVSARRAERIMESVHAPKWRQSATFPLYRWYYQTQALFQSEKGRGRRWESWNENLKSELLKAQQANGSWPMPGGDNSFRVEDKTDLAIYSSSLCALMLQVYYRYLPSYSIAESTGFNTRIDDYELGGGTITRLPGGADPLAAVILGIGENEMEPIKFGEFNGIPENYDSPLAEGEFTRLASMRSTIAVRKTEEWPQTLQPNQRIAIFLDELLPRNFKGHMRLRLGIVSDRKSSSDYQISLEAVINGKRLYNAIILRNKQLVEIIVPRDVMQPFENILQLRHNGKATLAFDAAELSSIHKVGGKLYLLTNEKQDMPADLRNIFNDDIPESPVICKLSSNTENRQLLPKIKNYDSDKTYIGEYLASGSENMGNEFQKHYLSQTGREIVDWIAGGGSGVKINSIMTGGKFYDSVFHEEYPALSALRQTAKLFEGNPHKLASQIYPKHGEKPALFCSVAAAYNASGIATIVIAKRFPIPEETELITLIPWSGATEVIIEHGFLPENSPFVGFASKIETEKRIINISDNIFRHSAVFPELTVIRLMRKGSRELRSPYSPYHNPIAKRRPAFNHSAIKNQLPRDAQKLKKHALRKNGEFASVFGQNVSFAKIPATQIPEGTGNFIPSEKESINVIFRTNITNPRRFDSVYLSLGNTLGFPRYMTFDVYARASGLRRHERMPWATLRFVLCGQLYSTTVPLDRWQKVVIPLDGINPSWQNLRILEPVGVFSKNLQSISFEINDISVYTD
ncbi:MAG: hypothetical protein JXR78_00640 [Victivallales bacterium]|nr:hypothetical protein [Victivallales bacterium]